MTTYTPPEPVHSSLAFVAFRTGMSPVVHYFSESQLRSEVERIRRETVEECARIAEQYEETSIGHTAIRELLK